MNFLSKLFVTIMFLSAFFINSALARNDEMNYNVNSGVFGDRRTFSSEKRQVFLDYLRSELPLGTSREQVEAVLIRRMGARPFITRKYCLASMCAMCFDITGNEHIVVGYVKHNTYAPGAPHLKSVQVQYDLNNRVLSIGDLFEVYDAGKAGPWR